MYSSILSLKGIQNRVHICIQDSTKIPAAPSPSRHGAGAHCCALASESLPTPEDNRPQKYNRPQLIAVICSTQNCHCQNLLMFPFAVAIEDIQSSTLCETIGKNQEKQLYLCHHPWVLATLFQTLCPGLGREEFLLHFAFLLLSLLIHGIHGQDSLLRGWHQDKH